MKGVGRGVRYKGSSIKGMEPGVRRKGWGEELGCMGCMGPKISLSNVLLCALALSS